MFLYVYELSLKRNVTTTAALNLSHTRPIELFLEHCVMRVFEPRHAGDKRTWTSSLAQLDQQEAPTQALPAVVTLQLCDASANGLVARGWSSIGLTPRGAARVVIQLLSYSVGPGVLSIKSSIVHM
jgi:hypothetical protein